MEQRYRRGDIYLAELRGYVGSEQHDFCPVIIIQNDISNIHSPTVIVVPLSAQTRKKNDLPTHCYFDDIDGISAPSVALLEQIITIDKECVSGKIGHLTNLQMEEINQGLLVSLGYIRSKPKALEVCLCQRCLGSFYDANKYIVRRKNPYQVIKGDCTYCNYGKGWDYLVTIKARR